MPDSREVAFKTIEHVLKTKEFAENVFAKFAHELPKRDRALAWEIINGVFRRMYYLDYKIKKASKSCVIDKEVINILRLGAYQILYLDRVPSYAAVSESVKLADKLLSKSKAKYVNAILRCISGNIDLSQYKSNNKVEYLSINYSFPVWIVKKFIQEYGFETTEEILFNLNIKPQLFLRVNTRKISRDELIELFGKKGINAHPVDEFPEYIMIDRRGVEFEELVGYKEGYYIAQDPSFSIPVYLLSPRPAELILEIGASPGGKSTHIAEKTTEVVLSLDFPEKVDRLVENRQRLGLNNIVIVAANGIHPPFKHSSFDKILLDAPCSNFGVIRRHPEIRYIKSPSDIMELANIQTQLARKAYELLKPGGTLVYSTCTLTREENENIANYLQELGMKIEPPHEFQLKEFITDEGYVKILPGQFDGSFCARLVKI
ncbi:MAG: 16S rRNA (cytosine(967)-C(5))-methyltransferase RsmB [bacterium]